MTVPLPVGVRTPVDAATCASYFTVAGAVTLTDEGRTS